MNRMIHNSLLENFVAPVVQHKPTAENPFIFYHLEKSGGSSIRRDLIQSSLIKNINFYLPCYDGDGVLDVSYLTCYQWDLKSHISKERAKGVAVTGGHWQWNVRYELPTPKNYIDDISCFTIQRHPIERILSFWYERVLPYRNQLELEGNGLLNEQDPGKVEFLLRYYYY